MIAWITQPMNRGESSSPAMPPMFRSMVSDRMPQFFFIIRFRRVPAMALCSYDFIFSASFCSSVFSGILSFFVNAISVSFSNSFFSD